MLSGVKLRPYQEEAVGRVRGAYKAGHRRVLLVSPTGSGKTVTFVYLCERAAAAGKRVLITAHREQICDQISETLTSFGVPHGTIMSGRSMTGYHVQVGMMQTVARRMSVLRQPDFIVVDEAHRAPGPTYRRILDEWTAARTLLVTATPQRTDGKGLNTVADVMVHGPSVRWLIDHGHLAKYRLFCPPPLIDLSGVRRVAGDVNQGDLQAATDKPEITGDALAHYKRLASGKRFVVFTTGTEHSRHIAEKFTAEGVPTRYISGDMDRGVVSGILRDLAAGKVLGVASCNLISEGFDLPSIECAILLRYTESIIVYLQQVGRALRPSPGKQYAIILDHVGNSVRYMPDGTVMERHGLPDKDRTWSLDAKEKPAKELKEADIPLKQCNPGCFMWYSGNLRVCPHCGLGHTPRSREVNEIDGELAEVDYKAMAHKELLEGIKSIDDIKRVRAAMGYKAAWALRCANERLGMTPHAAAKALGYKPGVVWRSRA